MKRFESRQKNRAKEKRKRDEKKKEEEKMKRPENRPHLVYLLQTWGRVTERHWRPEYGRGNLPIRAVIYQGSIKPDDLDKTRDVLKSVKIYERKRCRDYTIEGMRALYEAGCLSTIEFTLPERLIATDRSL